MDLSTTYMGLELAHPIAASASPLSEQLSNIRRMEDEGAAAVVLFSLFEEQIRHESEAFEHLISHGANSFAEALTYFPGSDDYMVGAEEYLELVRSATEAVDIPVIGSLNGVTNEGWIDYAREIERAGARAIELNVYAIAGDLDKTGAEVEAEYLEILGHVKGATSIPVALKLSPFFSAFGNMARRLDAAGADALVLFNRFYHPEIDIERREVEHRLELSTPAEMHLPLMWIARLHGRIRASLGATRGVYGPEEVIKYLLAGADAVFTTGALLKHGIEHLQVLVGGLREWMERNEYASVAQMKGSMSQRNVADPSAYERANYLRILERYQSPYSF